MRFEIEYWSESERGQCIGHDVRGGGPPSQIFDIWKYPKRDYIWSEWPGESFYKIRITFWPLFGTKTTFFEILANFGLIFTGFAFRFQRARARASILKMTAKSTSVGKPKNNLDSMSFWRNFGKKTTFLLIWVLTSFLKGFWSKIPISGSGRNFCHIAEISIFPYPE